MCEWLLGQRQGLLSRLVLGLVLEQNPKIEEHLEKGG